MRFKTIATLFMAAWIFQACGNSDNSESSRGSGGSSSGAETADAGLNDFELEHGIGPVTERLEQTEIEPARVDEGRSIFDMKCAACHNLDSRLIGPALGEVTDRRSREFVVNFIMNPDGMTREHPVGKELLQEYLSPMPYQNVTVDEAISIVDYLRDHLENQLDES